MKPAAQAGLGQGNCLKRPRRSARIGDAAGHDSSERRSRPLLRTDSEVLQRVEQLVGAACHPRQLWIMWLDGDGRQAPVVMPIADLPRNPDALLMRNLRGVIAGLRGDLATDAGPGSVILTLERTGAGDELPRDHRWAHALRAMCDEAGVELRGLFLSTDGGVRPLI